MSDETKATPANGGSGETPAANGDGGAALNPSGGGVLTTADSWSGLSPEQQTAIEKRFNGVFEEKTASLKTALDSEREQRKQYAKQLKELSAAAGDNEQMKATVAAMQKDLADREFKLTFYESAPQDLANAKLALLTIKSESDKYLKRGGAIDWDALREDFGLLFNSAEPVKPKVPTINGGRKSAPLPADPRTAFGQGLRRAALKS